MARETEEIRLDSLLPFKIASGQTYEGKQLEQLMSSVEKEGLMNPVIVRPAADGKYEIICGHNWIRAMESIGSEVIHAEVRHGLSDEDAIELFMDSSLNQRFFSDLNYSQKFEVIKHFDKVIRANSRQGKRTDLEKKTVEDGGTSVQVRQKSTEDNRTSVQNRQKSTEKSKHETTRDKVARNLGMSPSDFSMYRRIIKLPDKLLESMTELLDERRLTFEAAYVIASRRDEEIEYLLECLNECPNMDVDLEKVKELPKRIVVDGGVPPLMSRKRVKEALVLKKTVLNPVRSSRS